MEKVKNLYSVKATILPSKVMVMLSKYSQAVKKADGVIIPLSSLNVFKHVHNSFSRTHSSSVRKCYLYLLHEVNRHLAEGNMAVFSENDRQETATDEPQFDERYENTNFRHKYRYRRDSSVSIMRSH